MLGYEVGGKQKYFLRKHSLGQSVCTSKDAQSPVALQKKLYINTLYRETLFSKKVTLKWKKKTKSKQLQIEQKKRVPK